MIWFVGAGCYHPDMLTIGAQKLLQKADCVLYDHLVNKEFLQYTKPDCECICVGKRGHQTSFLQEDIYTLLVQKDKIYKHVVRLKGGDPFLFARGSEEMRYVLEHGCDCQYVPGISSAIGALGYAGIPVTQRNQATGFVVHTMHYQDGQDHLNYKAIAQEKNTQIFFMGSHKLDTLVHRCLENGMDPSTPIALGSHLSYPKQKVLCSTLQDILNEDRSAYDAPLLIVLGKVVENQSLLDNTTRLACFPRNVLFCSIDKTPWPVEILALEYGIFPHVRQVGQVKYGTTTTWNDNYDTLIFSSVHAVQGFFMYLQKQKKDVRSLLGKKIWCVGKKTEKALNERGLFCDRVAMHLQPLLEHVSDRTCYIKGENTTCTLPSFDCYRIEEIPFDLPEEKLDAIGVTCPQALEILYRKKVDLTIPLFCFGHKSLEKAKELDFQKIHVCPSSREDIVQHMLAYWKR